jgi:hypothetical protein
MAATHDTSRWFTIIAAGIALLATAGITTADELSVPGEYPTIQDAIDASSDGDVIIVSDGNYSGEGFYNIDFHGKDIWVISASMNPTQCILDCQMLGRGVIFDSGESADARLDGFTITNGFMPSSGGGIYIGNGSPTIRNCWIQNCWAEPNGGAVYIGGHSVPQSPSFISCKFENSIATDEGGGVYVTDDYTPSFENCDFSQNEAYGNGGGLRVFQAEPTLIGCDFDGDTATNGGAVAMTLTNTNAPSYTGCDFEGNDASAHAGAVFINGGSPTFTQCDVLNNSAIIDGGGIYATDGALSLSTCVIEGNTTNDDGGGIYVYQATLEITDGTFQANIGGDGGGGLCYIAEYDCTISNSTFSNNDGPFGGGIYIARVGGVGPTVTLENCSFTGDSGGRGGGVYVDEAELVANDCEFNGNSTTIGGGAVFIEGGFTATNTNFIYNFANGSNGGGAIATDGASLTLTDCLFDDNHAATETRGGGAIQLSACDLAATGCTFTSNDAPVSGGAMYGSDSACTVTTCTFSNNMTGFAGFEDVGGGAIAIEFYSELELIDCEFIANIAARNGGVLRIIDESTAFADGCTFESNQCLSGDGGCIQSIECDLTLTACTFGSNSTQPPNGRGGAVYASGAMLEISDCSFVGHTAYGLGGAVAVDQGGAAQISDCLFEGSETVGNVDGGAVGSVDPTPLFVDHCTFLDNHAGGFGGAISQVTDTLTVVSSDFIGNTAEQDGGAIDSNLDAIVSHSRFMGNHADDNGGAVRFCGGRLFNCIFSSNTAAARGGAVTMHSYDGIISGCAFWNNNAGSAMSGAVDEPHDGSSIVYDISNSVFWGNEPAQIGSTPTSAVAYCDVQGGWSGEGNIDLDPMFVDPDGPDNIPGTIDDDLHLLCSSPCIDAANNDAVPEDELDLDGDSDTTEPCPFDLDGNPRCVDDPNVDDTGHGDPPIVDMGAYEFQAGCLADLTHDGTVNVFDLLALLLVWGEADVPADLNCDGTVNVFDLLDLLATWGPC